MSTHLPTNLQDRVAHALKLSGLKPCEQLEVLATLVGAKPLVRLVADEDCLSQYRQLANDLELKCQASCVKHAVLRSRGTDVFTHTVPWNDPRGKWFSVFVGHDIDIISRAIRVEAMPDGRNELGLILGYPDCCVQSYRHGNGDWLESMLTDWRERRTAFALSNPLARRFSGWSGFLPDFYPCSLTCHEALALANGYRQVLLDLGEHSLVASITEELSYPVLAVGKQSLVQMPRARLVKDVLTFDPTRLRYDGHVADEIRTVLNRGELSPGNLCLPRDQIDLIQFTSATGCSEQI